MPITPDDSRLTAYVLDEVGETERAEIEAALASSSELRDAVAEIRTAASLMDRALAAEPEPVASTPALEESVPSSGASRFLRGPNSAVAAAALLVALGAGALIWEGARTGHTTSGPPSAGSPATGSRHAARAPEGPYVADHDEAEEPADPGEPEARKLGSQDIRNLLMEAGRRRRLEVIHKILKGLAQRGADAEAIARQRAIVRNFGLQVRETGWNDKTIQAWADTFEGIMSAVDEILEPELEDVTEDEPTLDPELQRRLATTFMENIDWRDTPVKTALDEIVRSAQINVVFEKNAVGDARVTLVSPRLSVASTLESVARQLGLSITARDGIVILGRR